MHITPDDLTGPEIRKLLSTYFADMRSALPQQSQHFLNLDGLKAPDVAVWSIWDGAALAGCGALRQLDPNTGEIKSMCTDAAHLGKGVGTVMLLHIIAEAKMRGLSRLYLGTGTNAVFNAAHALYLRHGFLTCSPYGHYMDDPHRQYMTREI